MSKQCGIYILKFQKHFDDDYFYFYIGSSYDMHKRWNQHRAMANAQCHHNDRINHLVKCGYDFEAEIFCVCEYKQLKQLEQEVIQTHVNLYGHQYVLNKHIANYINPFYNPIQSWEETFL